MKTTSLAGFSILFLGWAALNSCTRAVKPVVPVSRSTFTPAEETGPYVVIGRLQHRDRVITIKTGDQGTVYTVQNNDGTVIFDNLTAAQLKEKSPTTHDFIEGSQALDAGLGLRSVPLSGIR